MWAYELDGPSRIREVECPEPGPADLGPGELLLRFVVGGICGSDVPKFTGAVHPSVGDQPGPGFPLHEVVARVVASESPRFRVGDRVVGFARGAAGLRELFVNPDAMVSAVPAGMPDVHAVAAQPLATILGAAERAVDVRDARVAVLGLGPLGLLLAYVMKARGARSVVGVDPVDRADVAADFGIDVAVAATARAWVDGLDESDRPDVCVEAVGHQRETLADAIRATAPGGHVLAFGVVDSDDYLLPFRTFFRKNLSLSSGTTRHQDWTRYLQHATEFLAEHPLDTYASHVLPVAEAQKAYDLASTPAQSRLKVVLTA